MRNKIFRKFITVIFLLIYNIEIFATNLVVDPNSNYNTKLDESANGVPIVNISTPNNRGVSINEFSEYNIDEKGQILNNADNFGRSYLGGLINANPNLAPNQAANLVILKVNGSNRSQIEGYLEALSREKIDVILANENGLYINNSGTINIKNFTATTGKINLKDGDFIGIDVEKGNIVIGSKGIDGNNTNYVELIAKTLELRGKVVANDLKIVTGSNNNVPTNNVAIDAKELGGMYANKIKIISTDKGAGVNSDAFIVSKNSKLEITADGKIKVNKVQGKGIDIKGKEYEQKDLAYSDEEISINADKIKISGTGTKANKQINLNGAVENNATIYSKEGLKTKGLNNTGVVQAINRIEVEGDLTNKGTIASGNKFTINGNLENTNNIESMNIEVVGNKLINSGNIKSDNISTKVTDIVNDGIISSFNDIIFSNTKNISNRNEIIALKDIKINHANLKNNGKIASNGKILLNDSNIANTNKILSNTIEMKENKRFINTGEIKGNDVTLESRNDIDLVGKLHGAQSLTISGKNIVNDGETTGTGTTTITVSDNFTNNSELSAQTLVIKSKENVVNNKMLSGGKVSLSGNNIENNDLISAAGDLILKAENKVENKVGKTIFAGNNLSITAKEIKNNKNSELLGTNIELEADRVKNEVGTIKAFNDITIKTDNFENIGEVKDLDKYESYYETWDGKILNESEVNDWKRYISPHIKSRSGSGSSGSKVRSDQRAAYKEVENKITNDKYKSLLFPKYTEYMKRYLGNEGEYTEKTGSTRIQDIPLKEKVRSKGETEYGKVLAGGNITIEGKDGGKANEVLNKDSIISAGNTVKIDTNKLENIVSIGEKVKVKTGEETMFVKYHRKKRRFRGDKISAEVTYTRDFTNDYIKKKVPVLDENGKPVLNFRGRKKYKYVKEYIGRFAYVTGSPSIIEGKNVEINNLVKQEIDDANGKINDRISKDKLEKEERTVNVGIAKDKSDVTVNSIMGNTEVVDKIIKESIINIDTSLSSALFTKNVSPDSKYIMETRAKYINQKSFFGSDYFLSRIGYEEKWDRVRRLGDAYYENELIERSITEKLGTRFLNGKEVSLKDLIDNAAEEAKKNNLEVGKSLTKEQISKLDKDIVWYEYQNIDGIQVLAPRVYLSQNTLKNLNTDTRSRITGLENTYVKTGNLENTGLIGGYGNTYVEAKEINNRTLANQLAEIRGNNTTIIAQNSINNIGARISGNENLNLVAVDGDIVNKSTVEKIEFNNGEFDRSKFTEIDSVGEIVSNGTLNMLTNNYTSVGAITQAKNLKINAKDIDISSQKVSGEQKFGKDDSQYNYYGFERNIGSVVRTENLNVRANNLNLSGSALTTKTANLNVDKLNIESKVEKEDEINKASYKGFLKSGSKKETIHNEENSAGSLYVENKGIIRGDVNLVGSNLVLGDNSIINGKLTTDSNELHSSYSLEEKKKGFSSSIGSSGFSIGYGKTESKLKEKDLTNAKSNLVLGDNVTLNKGADITATNLIHGQVNINNGDVKFGARKDTKDVETSTKSSGLNLSVKIKSEAVDRAKQGIDSFKQMKSGDIFGGIASSTNTVTGVVNGLASNQGTKLPTSAVNADNTVGKDNLKAAQANNNFYADAGVNFGYTKSSSKTNSHNESAVVTTIKGKDENSSITYDNVKNIDYVGTQAQDTKFIYNNVENINKTAVELKNSYSSTGKSSGISTGVTIGYGDGTQTSVDAVKVSASQSKMNSNGTSYQNGRFVNVDEVHNNTKNMTLSGFNQEGGKVTGNIENLTIESKQNRSITKGRTIGGSLSIAPNGMPSGSANYSQTNGERRVVDNASTFIIGDGSNLKVAKVENTAGAIGTTGNGKLSIDEYVGYNLENVDKLKTVGGSVGVSASGITSLGVNYSDRKQEGITKNTVIGNVEIGKSSGDEINRDLDSMTEITKDRDFKTNVNIESQTINYAKNPEKFKEDLEKAKNEIYDIYHAVDSTVNLQGKENRNILEQLGEVRQAKTIYNVIDSRLQEAENQEDIAKAFEGVSEDLGYKVKVIYTDPSNSPQLIGVDKNGNKYIKDGTAYVDKDTGIGYILVNTKSPANRTKAGVIGTLAEEQSHVIGKKEGRQKLVPDESEKGLESLGRPTNDYFKKQYSKNDKAIGLKSDGKDYSNVDFGENVGDHISPEDLKFKKNYNKNVLPNHEGYQNFLNNTLSMGLDVSPLGVAKGATEAILGYDTITGEKLDLVTRTMGIIPIFDDIYKTGRSGIKLLTPTRKVENVLADSSKVMSNVDDTIKGTNNTKKIISSTDTSIPKIEVETPKIKPVEDIIGTKTGNKELNNAINTREKGYYLKQLDEKKAPVFATISDEKLTSFQNEVSKTGTKLDLKTGELIGPKGGKGKVVGTTPDGKIVANMAGRNVIFENGKQNPVSAGSFKKFEIPKTNEVVEVPSEVIAKNNTKKPSENMFNGFLDKAKSKITGKPVAQVQLERIGIKSEVKDIGLKVDGTTKTGLDIDKALENNLGRTFKTYDSYDDVTKTAISVKSVDMTSKTYTSGSGLSSKLNSDLKDIKDFTKYKLDKVRLENKDIEVRILKIVINNEPLNKSQIENLKKVVNHATEEGIKVEAVILK